MHALVKVLSDLGVDFDAKEHKHYRFKAQAMMDLIVETWPDPKGQLHLSVAHYGKQNGDAMADPEMEFLVGSGEIGPISYRNDYLGIVQWARFLDDNGKEMIRPGLVLELRKFAAEWARNIKAQEYARSETF